jgi:hypothetical protein
MSPEPALIIFHCPKSLSKIPFSPDRSRSLAPATLLRAAFVDSLVVHRKEPLRTSIFVHHENRCQKRSVMSRAVIIAAKFAIVAWMLRPVAITRTIENFSVARL